MTKTQQEEIKNTIKNKQKQLRHLQQELLKQLKTDQRKEDLQMPRKNCKAVYPLCLTFLVDFLVTV